MSNKQILTSAKYVLIVAVLAFFGAGLHSILSRF